MAIGIVIPNWPAEAVEADDALGMVIALRRQGTEVHVFSPDGRSSLPIEVYHYDDLSYLFSDPEDLVIYHRSAGDHVALPYLCQLQCRLIVRYHGIIPAASLLPFSESAARAARQHRTALHAVLQLPADAFLVATEIQAAELQKLGVPAKRIGNVPYFHAVERLRDLPDDRQTLDTVEAHAINLAVLDDIRPWTGLELLLDTLEKICADRSLPMHFHFVGRQFPEFEAYTSSLMRRITAIGSRCITFHPPKAAVRATLLRHCDVVLSAQRDAGPGGRSLEALGFGRPVIATPDSDTAELCGPAACRATTVREFVHELRRLLPDQELLAKFSTAARERFTGQFRTPSLEARFLQELRMIQEQSLVRVEASTIQARND